MVQLRLLGPVEIETDQGVPLALGAGRIRTVAAVLISEVNQAVPVNRLIDLAWDGDPPARARGVVHNHVHRLRRLLAGHAELATRGPGYVLLADPGSVDVHRFRSLVGGVRDVDPPAAVAMLRQALGLWRGEALADVPGERVRRTLGAGLAQARVAALQELGRRLLELGRYGELVTELSGWIAEHPHHEELTALLMRALQAGGRQAEALDHYHRARRHLKEQLGIDPGPALSQAYLAVLGGGHSPPPAAGRAQSAARHPAPATPPRAGPPPRGPRCGPSPGEPGAALPAAPYACGHRADPPPPRIAQLPPVVADFCGRERDLAVLDQHLDRVPRPACLVLAGAGGTGKTTLAVRWAHLRKAEFPDGQLFADLRGLERPPMRPGTVLAALLRALGVPEKGIPEAVTEAAALYRSLLAGRRMLVLLDDAGSPEQARPLLPATPGCLAVVTSRRRLSGLVVRDGAALVRVGPLAAEEGLQLLGNALGRKRIEADTAAARALVERCDRLPLALRIATARLMAHPEWSLDCWTDKLADERRRLRELSAHGTELTMETCLHLSYRGLSSGAARLFRFLGLHPGPYVESQDAGVLAGWDADRTSRHLAELCDAHLLEEDVQGHYVQRELVRLYAAQRVAAEEPRFARDEAVRRLLAHFARRRESLR
ncbi:NB-ARC domain-containing protein [Streptomyces sp. RS10V-4]|uniref:AfsR/SARP family transcriptional regulator n=1 Tax=Streptomyces rhizoryzae TaxID=2932493 RepID=UPI002003E189|nr:BTAD domain-containing putative transcriptional regulator [Streptomyces rhizoryzae]MCK7624474.1 NB-ARC domain-containing protein [Streptomyces rhizoryzae]